MATYNGESYVVEQLDSIKNQSRKVDEIIICDDKSKDNTVAIIQKYIQENPEVNIHFYENEVNLGYKKNFKKAVELCSGQYTFLCDQDDIWVNTKVEEMISIMEKNPHILTLASSFDQINQNNEPIAVELLENHSNNNLYWKSVKENDVVQITFDELVIQNFFQGCSMVFTELIKKEFIDYFTEELFHDWLINLLAAKRGGMYFFNKALFHYRIHPKNTIGLNEQENYESERDRLAVSSSSEHYRIYSANQSYHTLDVLLKVDPTLLQFQKDAKEKRNFYYQHVQNLKNKKFISTLLQNTSPYYKLVKSNKARIMDLIYCLKK